MSPKFLFLRYAIIGFSLNVSFNFVLICRMFQFLLIASFAFGKVWLYVRTNGIFIEGSFILYLRRSSLFRVRASDICWDISSVSYPRFSNRV